MGKCLSPAGRGYLPPGDNVSRVLAKIEVFSFSFFGRGHYANMVLSSNRVCALGYSASPSQIRVATCGTPHSTFSTETLPIVM